MNRLFRGVLVAAVFAASACGSDEPKTSAVTFEQYFNSFAFDFEPANSRGQLASRSTLVVEAVLIDVIDGPIFASSADDPAASRFALFVFESAEVAESIYVRLPRPNTSDIDEIRDAMPLGARAVLYLIPVHPLSANEKQLWFGVDPNIQEWEATTPQGFILERQTESGEAMVDLPIDGSDGLKDAPSEGSDISAWLPPRGAVVPKELATTG
ncbi:MAG: hypothetical protein WC864_01645 [Ilumatobacteraceae bacterium]